MVIKKPDQDWQKAQPAIDQVFTVVFKCQAGDSWQLCIIAFISCWDPWCLNSECDVIKPTDNVQFKSVISCGRLLYPALPAHNLPHLAFLLAFRVYTKLESLFVVMLHHTPELLWRGSFVFVGCAGTAGTSQQKYKFDSTGFQTFYQFSSVGVAVAVAYTALVWPHFPLSLTPHRAISRGQAVSCWRIENPSSCQCILDNELFSVHMVHYLPTKCSYTMPGLVWE